MDYLEWELERQRGALRALLGGGSLDGEALRETGPKRQPAGTDAAGGSALGQTVRFDGPTRAEGRQPARRSAAPAGMGAGQPAERSAAFAGMEEGQPAGRSAAPAGAEAEQPAEQETDRPMDRFPIRRNGSNRPEGAGGGSDAPVSAWEQVLAGEMDAPGQPGWDGPEELPSETPARPPREGTGPLAALPGASGEYERRTWSAEAPERAGVRRAGEPGGVDAAGAYTTGFRLANRRPAWALETGEPAGRAGHRDGGGAAASRAEDSARALSRAVQRDARRYDGGFTIY